MFPRTTQSVALLATFKNNGGRSIVMPHDIVISR